MGEMDSIAHIDRYVGNGRMVGRTDEWMDGWTYGQADQWMDGWING